jgi:hypothetical protein
MTFFALHITIGALTRLVLLAWTAPTIFLAMQKY